MPEKDKIPKLMFSILNGGKENNSKVKFSKFYLIMNFTPEDVKTIEIHSFYIKLVAQIEKSISSTKQGLSGFKRQPDGSFYNAFDNTNDSFKLLEDIINQTGINTPESKKLKIGLNTDANNWYLEDL